MCHFREVVPTIRVTRTSGSVFDAARAATCSHFLTPADASCTRRSTCAIPHSPPSDPIPRIKALSIIKVDSVFEKCYQGHEAGVERLCISLFEARPTPPRWTGSPKITSFDRAEACQCHSGRELFAHSCWTGYSRCRSTHGPTPRRRHL